MTPSAVVPTCSSSHARPGRRISALSRSRRRSSISSTRHQSSASPTTRSSGSRRPRRRPGPPVSRSMTPRTRQATPREYQPRSPPIPSTTFQSASGDAATSRVRSSMYRSPPAQSGSDGSGSLGAPAVLADDHRVGTCSCCIRASASSTARSNPIKPSGGSGMYAAMSCSTQTASWRRDSTSGLASEPGTGVMTPTQWLDSVGVSTGTGRIRRRRRPRAAAKRCIISR